MFKVGEMHLTRIFLAGLGMLLGILLMGMVKSSADVVLIGKNISLSFDDIEANFAAAVQKSGICGSLQVAEPVDACSVLTNKPLSEISFALTIRGTCTFETKVRNAQAAGFRAAIIYNNEEGGNLVAMAGNSDGITSHAVFISKAAGETLLKYGGNENIKCWIIPSAENTAWTVMAISFISLLAISAVLATCFFVRRLRLQRRGHRLQHHGISAWQVKLLPSLIFTSVADDNCTSETCAICLEDYSAGEKLRILPCHHKFHALCIDAWLTMWRTFCPVCKRDARTCNGDPPASEQTPLLSSAPLFSSLSSSSMGASTRSSLLGSPAMHIPSASLRSHASSSSYNASRYMSQSFGSSPISSINNLNIGNVSRHLSFQALFSHPNSLDMYGSLASRYGSPSPGSLNASMHSVSSFSRPPCLPSCSGSFTSISPFTSMNSLPGYWRNTN